MVANVYLFLLFMFCFNFTFSLDPGERTNIAEFTSNTETEDDFTKQASVKCKKEIFIKEKEVKILKNNHYPKATRKSFNCLYQFRTPKTSDKISMSCRIKKLNIPGKRCR